MNQNYTAKKRKHQQLLLHQISIWAPHNNAKAKNKEIVTSAIRAPNIWKISISVISSNHQRSRYLDSRTQPPKYIFKIATKMVLPRKTTNSMKIHWNTIKIKWINHMMLLVLMNRRCSNLSQIHQAFLIMIINLVTIATARAGPLLRKCKLQTLKSIQTKLMTSKRNSNQKSKYQKWWKYKLSLDQLPNWRRSSRTIPNPRWYSHKNNWLNHLLHHQIKPKRMVKC